MKNTLLLENMRALLDGSDDPVSSLANASALMMEALPDINWVGFYLLRDGALVLGPFQGRVACTRILLGRGVCSKAVLENRAVRVPDVHAFPGHIACDVASNSELVVPLRDGCGSVIGVLDIDSTTVGRFSADDEETVVALAAIIEKKL